MNYECEIIQDLIPLVKDNIASEKSVTAVSQHITECTKCKETYETDARIIFLPINDSLNTEISKVTHYKNRVKKRRKLIILLAITGAIILAVGTSLLTWFVVPKLLSGIPYTTRDISEYGNYTGHMEFEQEGMYSLLEIFPKELPPSVTVKDYYYSCSYGFLDSSYQLYLVCSYGKDDFAIEKERLESIEVMLEGEVHKPTITDTGFNYRAIVTIYDYEQSFEYALLDDASDTIIYVFTQSSGIDKSVVPRQHRPQEFHPPENELIEWGGYNIYLFKLNDGSPGSAYIMGDVAD